MWACAWACLDALCQPLHGPVDKTVLEVSWLTDIIHVHVGSHFLDEVEMFGYSFEELD